MKYLMLVSHATLAGGLEAALSMLLGSREYVLCCELHEGMAPQEYASKVEQEVACVQEQDQVIVLADVLGGAPLKTALAALYQKGLEANVIAFGGANLPMAIAAVMGIDDGLALEVIADAVLDNGAQAVARN